MYFSDPASKTARVNGVVRRSADGGRTWPYSYTVTAGDFAYSCLAPHPDRARLGLLWETSMDASVCVGASCQTVFSALPLLF